jgi:succinate dehydrogenase / fumarate reductase cytochrome b subunit
LPVAGLFFIVKLTIIIRRTTGRGYTTTQSQLLALAGFVVFLPKQAEVTAQSYVKSRPKRERAVQNDHRPINVNPSDLLAFAWPITALTSITHRISGVILFVGIAFGLYALEKSLASEEGFEALKGMMKSPFGMFVTWGLLSALAYHFVAGIKHLVMDFGVGETIESSKFASKITILFSAVLIFLAGIWVIQG